MLRAVSLRRSGAQPREDCDLVMELLIPGLILVALMVYASTKIKKRAAAAFEPEAIETEHYLLNKPEGFLHVIGDPDHEFAAYSKEFGENENARIRQARIEIDTIRDQTVDDVCRTIEITSKDCNVTSPSDSVRIIETDEVANEIELRGFYKIIAAPSATYQLRFAVLPEHKDDYLGRIDEALESFTVKTN